MWMKTAENVRRRALCVTGLDWLCFHFVITVIYNGEIEIKRRKVRFHEYNLCCSLITFYTVKTNTYDIDQYRSSVFWRNKWIHGHGSLGFRALASVSGDSVSFTTFNDVVVETSIKYTCLIDESSRIESSDINQQCNLDVLLKLHFTCIPRTLDWYKPHYIYQPNQSILIRHLRSISRRHKAHIHLSLPMYSLSGRSCTCSTLTYCSQSCRHDHRTHGWTITHAKLTRCLIYTSSCQTLAPERITHRHRVSVSVQTADKSYITIGALTHTYD